MKFSYYSANTTIPHPIKQHRNECLEIMVPIPTEKNHLEWTWGCLRGRVDFQARDYKDNENVWDKSTNINTVAKNFWWMKNTLLFFSTYSLIFSWKDFSLLLVVMAWTESWESLLIYLSQGDWSFLNCSPIWYSNDNGLENERTTHTYSTRFCCSYYALGLGWVALRRFVMSCSH